MAGTSPNQQALAGREFETHLQDVTIIGILWKYGGIYINPILKLAKGLSTAFPENTSAWISKELSQPTKSLSTLDVSFFHSFIHELANLYGNKYPIRRSDAVLFQQGYLRAVWNMALKHVCTAETSCPKVLSDVPTIVSSDYKLVNPSEGVSHFGLFARNQSATVAGLDNNRIQEFGEVQFLPFLDTFIDLDDPGRSCGKKNVSAFLNSLGGTESWKPPSTLHPVMLSVHLQESRDGSAEKIRKSSI